MTTSLTVVKTADAKKQLRERIQLLEMQPKDDWFVCTLTEQGRTVWHLRFAITGMFPRLYGPFPSKRKALLFLDRVIAQVLEASQQFDDICEEYKIKGEFKKLNWGPLIQHPLLEKVPAKASRGQEDLSNRIAATQPKASSMTEQSTRRRSCRIEN